MNLFSANVIAFLVVGGIIAQAGSILSPSTLIPVGVAGSILVSGLVSAFFVGRKVQQFTNQQEVLAKQIQAIHMEIGSFTGELREMQKMLARVHCLENPSMFHAVIKTACEQAQKEKKKHVCE